MEGTALPFQGIAPISILFVKNENRRKKKFNGKTIKEKHGNTNTKQNMNLKALFSMGEAGHFVGRSFPHG